MEQDEDWLFCICRLERWLRPNIQGQTVLTTLRPSACCKKTEYAECLRGEARKCGLHSKLLWAVTALVRLEKNEQLIQKPTVPALSLAEQSYRSRGAAQAYEGTRIVRACSLVLLGCCKAQISKWRGCIWYTQILPRVFDFHRAMASNASIAGIDTFEGLDRRSYREIRYVKSNCYRNKTVHLAGNSLDERRL